MTIPVRDVTNDSRQVQPGSLFVAIDGVSMDGRHFIAQAISKGAAGIVYRQDQTLSFPVPSFRVTDDYLAYSRMTEFRYGYPASGFRIVGVTGTNGKTTTAFLIQRILNSAGTKTGLIGTIHHDLGDCQIRASCTTPSPTELQDIFSKMKQRDVDAVVMEVSSHALEQGRLGSTRVETAVFTNLTAEHLDYHGSMDEYFRAKRKLFDEYMNVDGTAIINVDDPYGNKLYHRNRVRHPIGYGLRKDADYRGLLRDYSSSGTRLVLETPQGIVDLDYPLIGKFNAYNVMAAVSVAMEWGIPVDIIREAIGQGGGIPGRLQKIESETPANIFIDYAHTGDALQNVLTTLRPLCDGRLIVVFGCGGDRDKGKRAGMGRIASEFADIILITTDNPRTEAPTSIIADIATGLLANSRYRIIEDRREAIATAIKLAGPTDTVLVAGKGHEDYQDIAGEKLRFSDFDECRDAVRTLGRQM